MARAEIITVAKNAVDVWRGTDTYHQAAQIIDMLVSELEGEPALTPPNEPRMINADKLAKRIAGHSNYHGDSILAAIYCAAEGKENDAPIRPIETTPNEKPPCYLPEKDNPYTLCEGRGMNVCAHCCLWEGYDQEESDWRYGSCGGCI